MPQIRNLTVRVTTSSGEELKEWGVQHLRKANVTSCYVQSETDMAFRISIQPKIPYIAADTAAAHGYGTRRRGNQRPGFFDMEDEWEEDDGDDRPASDSESQSRPSSQRRTSSGRQHRKSESRDQTAMPAFPSTSRNFKKTPAPDFHFLASLYIDGRSTPERKLIVYLDPEEEDFNEPGGKVQFKSRWVEGRGGRLQEHSWLFKDVGIETAFDKMLISGARGASETVYKRDEEDLIAAMNCADIDGEGTEKDQKVKAGQIVVTIERVKLGEKWEDRNYRARYKEGEGEDVDMEGAQKDITHTTALGQARPVGSNSVRVVAYTPYNDGEGVYATFKFFYRSEEKLRAFPFANSPKSQLSTRTGGAARTRRQLNNQLAILTPLSLSNPLRPTPKVSKLKPTTFEDKVKKGELFEESAPYSFKDGYRDNSSEEDVFIKEEKQEEPASQLQNLLSIPPFTQALQEEQATSQTPSTEPSHNHNPLLQRHGFTDSTSEEEIGATQAALRQHVLAAGLSIPSAGLYPARDSSYPPSLASTPKASSSRDATPDTDASTNVVRGTPSPKGKARASSLAIPKTSLPPITTNPFPAKNFNPNPTKLSISGAYRKGTSETGDADDEYESDKETHLGSDLEKTSDLDLDLDTVELYGTDNDDQGLHSRLGDLDIRKRGRDDDNNELTIKPQSQEKKIQDIEREIPPGSIMNENGELMLQLPLENNDEKESLAIEDMGADHGVRAKRQKNCQDGVIGDESSYLGRDGH
ncbi:MAG: hypothetical protein M1812_004694 [Candelaria pacifica]|nr:MAG: hypothetical protein M1812_004694 [Candelaria pacifica]